MLHMAGCAVGGCDDGGDFPIVLIIVLAVIVLIIGYFLLSFIKNKRKK